GKDIAIVKHYTRLDLKSVGQAVIGNLRHLCGQIRLELQRSLQIVVVQKCFENICHDEMTVNVIGRNRIKAFDIGLNDNVQSIGTIAAIACAADKCRAEA